MDTYYVDGEFVNEGQALISVNDLIVLRGFGAFDFLVTYNRRPFYLKEHVHRLEESAKKIGLQLNHSHQEICDIVKEAVDRNPQHGEANIRIVCTGGVSADGVSPEGNGKLVVMVTAKRRLPEWWYSDGANIITVDIERFMPGAKSTNYLTAIWALREAHDQKAIESIYVDRNNRLLEGTTTNFYYFKDAKLITSRVNILPGITRSVILDLVRDYFEVELRDIDKNEIDTMEEVFISGSNKEIIPVIRINETVIGNGRPGIHTRKVMQLFKAYTTAYGQELV